MSNELPKGTFLVGNKLFGTCAACHEIVRLDKPILGSMHFCVPVNIVEKKRKKAAVKK